MEGDKPQPDAAGKSASRIGGVEMSEQSTPNTTPSGERIAKRLARAGVASRREAERMIEAGRVRVNGKRIDSPALNVTLSDSITVDDEALAEAEPMRLWRYNKPAGLVTSARDEKGRATVFEKLPPELPRVMSVGRLDLNSEGLLLLTNDGELKRKLELPSTGWLRRYRVRAHGYPTERTLAPLTRGIKIDGEKFQPMKVEIERQQGANVWLIIGLREGKNREIRRALEAVGLSVNRLIRISYGPFQLGDLPTGGVEEIKGKILRDQLGMGKAQETGENRGAAKKTAPKGSGMKARGPKPGGPKPRRNGPPTGGSGGDTPRGAPPRSKRG